MISCPHPEPSVGQTAPPPTVIAFYLPQFHPLPENDEWWGPGFTEWTNVARARPFFPGHYQPRLPGELGFYDLRLPETRESQADLARMHGVSAFCYWHYWFGRGRRMLELPFREVLRSGAPDFPFCLGWANQSWEGRWHGAPGRLLIEQEYPGLDDEKRHFAVLEEAFHDRRYLRVESRPLLYIYKPTKLPDPVAYTDRLRTFAAASGLAGLYLVGESTRRDWDPLASGFDAEVRITIPPAGNQKSALGLSLWDHRLNLRLRKHGLPAVYSYRRWADAFVDIREDGHGFPCVVPGWDNTPRAKRRGIVFHGAAPGMWSRQIELALRRLAGRSASRRILFVKSWNEWAEGNYLEPDRRYGRAFLEELATALQAHGGGAPPEYTAPCGGPR